MIRSVEIKGLRGIREGAVSDLTPLVVLVGPNGCGKSTVLDALLIGASPVPGSAIGRAVTRRATGARWLFWRGGYVGQPYIRVTARDQSVRVTSLNLQLNETEPTRVLFEVHEGNDLANTGDRGGEVVFEPGGRYKYDDVSLYLSRIAEVDLVEAGSANRQGSLLQLFSAAIEQGRRELVTGIMTSVVRDLSTLSILVDGNETLLYLEFRNHAIPASAVGEGIQVLLRLCLELAAIPSGVLLLEEPEVHQHPGAIRQSSKVIWGAVRRDIQVILSTHSLELIDALLAEAKDDAELQKLSVYRLQLEDGILKSHRDSGPEAALARSAIEDDLR
jgi:predicted ATPase